MAGTSDGEVPSRRVTQAEFIELTEEDRSVLRDCTRNSIWFRGVPLGIVSVLSLREVLVRTGYVMKLKHFKGLVYTGVFALSFYSGVKSYSKTCIAKIMALENSKLKDTLMKKMPKSAGQGGQYIGQFNSDQDDLNLLANHKSGPSEEEPLTDEQRHLASSTAIPSDDNRSSEDVRKAPNLYFDVEEAKEKKYSTYEELRKKHRERWNPPNVSSSSQTRMEQSKQKMRETDQDTKTSSSDVFSSWFDKDASRDDRTKQESGQQTNSQRDRTSYRQGPPPKKNKYGDIIE